MTSRFGYERLYSNGKLVVWMQRRCIVCSRFLSKRQKSYCEDCSKIASKHYNEDIEEHRKRNKTYYLTHKKKPLNPRRLS